MTVELTLGLAVRRIREHALESQGRMAEVLGVTNVHLCRIETGKALPSLALLREIREMYGFCPMTLVAIDAMERADTRGKMFTLTAHRQLLGLDVN